MNTTKSSKAQRVALYARISEDAAGEGEGVRRQRQCTREHAESRGWTIVADLDDNDISAKNRTHRPGYQRLLQLVRDDEIDAVVVFQTSRLVRNRLERAEVIDLFGRHRVDIVAIEGIDFQLSTAAGRSQAALMGEFDTLESDIKTERVAAAALDRAHQGRPSGNLGYGWRKQGTGKDAVYSVDPHQQAVVGSIVDQLLQGRALLAVTRDLNNRDEPSPEWTMWESLSDEEQQRRLKSGRRTPHRDWGKTTVKKIAGRWSNAGVCVYHPGKADEMLTDATWPALIERDKTERVRALLSAPERQKNGSARPGARKHAITYGVGECGVCGAKLRFVNRKPRGGKTYPMYICGGKGCIGRDKAAVDELVDAVVTARLSAVDAAPALLSDNSGELSRLTDERSGLAARLDNAADEYAAGNLPMDILHRITAQLKPQIQQLTTQIDQLRSEVDVSALDGLIGPAATGRWHQLGPEQQARALRVLGLRVVLHPSRRRPVPETVEFLWPERTAR